MKPLAEMKSRSPSALKAKGGTTRAMSLNLLLLDGMDGLDAAAAEAFPKREAARLGSMLRARCVRRSVHTSLGVGVTVPKASTDERRVE